MDDDSDTKAEVMVDPEQTTLLDLLEIAERDSTGCLMISGEQENGRLQWGAVVVCCDGTKETEEMMLALQETHDRIIEKWRKQTMN